MTAAPMFPGFDGLMNLSKREGVDIRPTLLRVLTDLYVQARSHSAEEARQFVELTSRLIDQVDDATRAAVRARLAIYPGTPVIIAAKLGIVPARNDIRVPVPSSIPAPQPVEAPPLVKQVTDAQQRLASNLSMQPTDAAEISEMFFRAAASERALILHNLPETPLKASPRIPAARAKQAIQTLEMAAYASDAGNFALEIGEALILPTKVAAQIVGDPGGEPLACAVKALDMSSAAFQRVLMFLNPEFGSSVNNVYRLSRLYDRLSERASLIMGGGWRGSMLAVTRAKYRPTLYDDERHRARATPAQTRPTPQPGSHVAPRTTSKNGGR